MTSSNDKSKKKLLTIIPIRDASFDDFATKFFNQVVDPGFEVIIKNLANREKASKRIESRYDVLKNGCEVINLIEGLPSDELDEYSGIYIADYDNAGVEQVREIVGMPVIGGSGPQLAAAVALCQRFAIITVDDVLTSMNVGLVRSMGLSDSLVGIYDMDMRIADLVPATLDQGAITASIMAQATQAVVDGAQMIVLGCTGFLGYADSVQKTLGRQVHRHLERSIPEALSKTLDKAGRKGGRLDRLAHEEIYIPVLDPNVLAINFLAMLVRCGLSQSEVCYRVPPALPEERAKKKREQRLRLAAEADKTGAPSTS